MVGDPSNNQNSDLVKGTRKTSFFLGLTSGVAATSTLALIGLFILLFSGQTVLRGGTDAAVNSAVGVNTNQIVDNPVAPLLADLPPITADDYIKGGEGAQVLLVEYSDFECPYCARHYQTMKQVEKEYGNKVQFVFRHFPLSFHPNAQKAAEAAECAGEQGKFWEMHDKIFEANLAETMSVEKWKDEAKNLGLNTSKFNDCLDSGKYADKISQQMDDGSAAGVEGTPATFVNGELISGALPYDQFKQIIDSYL